MKIANSRCKITTNRLVSVLILTALAVTPIGLSGSAVAQSTDTAKVYPQRVQERFSHQSQAGLRLGAWSHLGDEPVPFGVNADTTLSYETDLNDVNFYIEFYFSLRLHPLFMAELSLGMVNRGDVSVREFNDEFIGSLVGYPIELRGKFYPIGKRPARFQPYLIAGAGVFHVRNNIQFVTTDDLFTDFRGDSETDFLWMIGGGIDWPLARPIALDLQGSYRPISLSRNFFSMKNHDALTITIGIKYLMPLETGSKR